MSRKKKEIKAVIFDIGMVLLFFDFKSSLAKLKGKCGVSEEKLVPTLFESGLVDLYDRGLISTLDFAREGCHLLGYEESADQFIEIWSNIFKLNEPMARRAKRLKERGMPIYLLSNTCESHIDFFKVHFDLFRIFDGEVYSCQERCMKPEPKIYEIILERYDLKPEATLFIDDRKENVSGARKMGIHAIHYKDEVDLNKRLKLLGLE